jgi:hypothetical protein
LVVFVRAKAKSKRAFPLSVDITTPIL